MSIFAPMGAMAALTSAVLLQVPIRRFLAMRAGAVSLADFALGEAPAAPVAVALANRNFMNLLEVPTLFYVVCLMYAVSACTDATALAFAWTYVALRCIHSVIHLTYNAVLHRLVTFAISNAVLVALWAWFFAGA